jgi:hypothetical protein
MGKKSGVCRFCGEIKPFAKAHVISRTLFKDIFKKYQKVHFLNVKDLDGSNRVQDAFFDTHILCADCDRSFSPIENYFTRLIKGDLLNKNGIQRVKRSDFGLYMVDTYQNVQSLNLRQFYLLTLWRCSISMRSTFDSVQLGDGEAEILEHLTNKTPGDFSDYATVLVSFEYVDDIRSLSAIGPANATVDGLPITVILFNQWAIIYCMKKQVRDWFFAHSLDDSGDLSVILFKESFGVEFLHQLTHVSVHIKKKDVNGL